MSLTGALGNARTQRRDNRDCPIPCWLCVRCEFHTSQEYGYLASVSVYLQVQRPTPARQGVTDSILYLRNTEYGIHHVELHTYGALDSQISLACQDGNNSRPGGSLRGQSNTSCDCFRPPTLSCLIADCRVDTHLALKCHVVETRTLVKFPPMVMVRGLTNLG